MLHLCKRLLTEDPTASDLPDLHEHVLDISRQLGSWIESLKNTETLDPRDRNEATRTASNEAKRREAFVRQLQRVARGEITYEEDQNPK